MGTAFSFNGAASTVHLCLALGALGRCVGEGKFRSHGRACDATQIDALSRTREEQFCF